MPPLRLSSDLHYLTSQVEKSLKGKDSKHAKEDVQIQGQDCEKVKIAVSNGQKARVGCISEVNS